MSNLNVKYRLKVGVITPRGTVEGYLETEFTSKEEVIGLREFISTNFNDLQKLELVDDDDQHFLLNQHILEQSVIFCKVHSYL